MTTVTSTEAGASGRYIAYDQAALDDLGSQTIMVYAKPTASGGGGFGYLFGKTPSNSIDGNRLFVDHNGGSPKLTFGASSTGGTGLPTASTTAGTVTYSSWANFCITWDGTLNGSGINLYIDGTDQRDAGSLTDGSTSVKSDAADPVYIMNRQGLTREHVGDYAYIAIWDRVLNSTERATARNDGPLDVPSGLVLLFANDADLGPGAYTQTGRSTRVTGSSPPNTALGGSGSAALAGAAVGGATAAGSMAEYRIEDNYERSSVNVASSTITGGAGDAALITLAPRLQESEVVSGTRWLEPSARVVGVNGKRPTFRFSGYNASNADGTQHGDWASTRRPKFSYDRVTWYDFDTQTIGSTYIEFRHNTTFTSDTVYISRSRQMSVEQTGAWLASLASTYPTLIGPSPSALAYTLSGSVAGFSGQTFIADEFSTQTDELGRTIPVTPFYAAMIEDVAQVPTLVNLLTYTEDFSNSVWSKYDASIASNAVASPGGGVTADKLVENTSSVSHWMLQTPSPSPAVGVVHTCSVYVKAAGRTKFAMQSLSGTMFRASFNLADGSAAVLAGSVIACDAVALGDGWYRCRMTWAPDAAGAYVGFVLMEGGAFGYVSDGTSGMHFWGAQLEVGTVATPYQPVMPVANLLTFPDAFDNAAWASSNCPVSANVAIAPDGTRTADKLVESTANAAHWLYQYPGFVGGTTYTITVYAKAAERSHLIIQSYDGTTTFRVRYSLSDGSTALMNGSPTAYSATAVGDGWYRCAMTWTPVAFGNYVGFIVSQSVAFAYTGDGTSGLYLWGAKLEAASAATPYRTKRLAVLASGVHAGEDHANFVHKAVVERLLGSSAEAIQIRKNYRIAVPPLINAPGKAGGGWRGSFTQGGAGEDDANRHFNETGTTLQIIDKPKAALTTDRAGALVAWAIDFHGTYGSKWASFEDAAVPASATFRSLLATEAGYAITDEGDSHVGFLSEYLRGLGAAFAVTVECGDPSPVSDAEITAHAAAIVRTIDRMTTGAALTGAATGGASATGALSTAIRLVGAAIAGASAAGSLSAPINLVGASATISAAGAGALTTTIRLDGAAVAAAIASGTLNTSGLAGAAVAGAAGASVLTTQITLSGAAIAAALASGALTATAANLAGGAVAGVSGAGVLSTGIPLAGAATASVVGAGGLVTAIQLAGAASAAISAGGNLVVSVRFSGAALTAAVGSGALLTSVSLSGAAVAGAVAAGLLSDVALRASPRRTATAAARVRRCVTVA